MSYKNDQELNNLIEQINQDIKIDKVKTIYPYQDMGIYLSPMHTGKIRDNHREEISKKFIVNVKLLDNNKVSEECKNLNDYIKSKLEQ